MDVSGGQHTKRRRNIAENYNRLSRVYESYRQTDRRQTDGRATAYSERELTFTFAENVLAAFFTVLRKMRGATSPNFAHFESNKRTMTPLPPGWMINRPTAISVSQYRL